MREGNGWNSIIQPFFPVNINGWRIADNNNDSHLISSDQPVVIPAKSYLVLGETTEQSLNGNAPVGYAYGKDFVLGNSRDEIILLQGDTVIHSVGYGAFQDEPWSIVSEINLSPPEGAALGMSEDYCFSVVSNWEAQISFFGSMGDRGTPGQDNDGVALCVVDATPPSLLNAKICQKRFDLG